MTKWFRHSGGSIRLGVRRIRLPSALRCCKHFFDLERLYPLPNLRPVNAVAVADQISRHGSIAERFDDLLGNPGRSRMVSHVEVQNTNRTCSRTVGTVKKSTETISLRWLRRNVFQVCLTSACGARNLMKNGCGILPS